jgi:hypothetical protein
VPGSRWFQDRWFQVPLVRFVPLPRPALFKSDCLELKGCRVVAVFVDLGEVPGKKSLNTPEALILGDVRKFVGDQRGVMAARGTNEESVSRREAVGHL